MKKQVLLGLFMLLFVHLYAQEQLGPATFTIPAGWEMTKTDNTVTLQKAVQKGVVCKISIALAQKGAVSTIADYSAFRNQYSHPGVTYPNLRGAITKYEADGLVSFFSKGTIKTGVVKAQNYFYSLSNGNQTLYYQLLTSNNSCIEDFNKFQEGLQMETDSKGSSNARKRKAAPAAPAAPAPMM